MVNFMGLYFLLHGGKESTEDTVVFEALCFFFGGTIKKLRELLEGRGIERPAVFLGGGVDKFKGLYFLFHGGKENTEDTEVFEALCF